MRFYLPEEGGGAKTHTQNRLISIKTSIKSIIYRNICSNSCFGFCWRHQACPISSNQGWKKSNRPAPAPVME